MKNFIKKLFAYIFPARCVGCRIDGTYVCTKCLRSIPFAEKPTKDWIVSVWSYKDPRIKKLLWMLKFQGTFSIIENISQEIYDHLSHEVFERALFENITNVAVVPIPLSMKSLRTRGYNQARLVAEAVVEKSYGQLTVMDALYKPKETLTQHSIKNKSIRLKNLNGAYAVRNGYSVHGRNIIIIDDITTTHATLIEARRVLKAAGARTVLGFTIAH